MTAQAYIKTKLAELKQPLNLPKPTSDKKMAEAIFKLVTSKKFRKYSLGLDQSEQIKESIRINVKHQSPIKATLVFGGYKLWRLDESPEPDWAELMSLIYYTNWMKPICQIYRPGVWFDFFSDDVIVPQMNNVSPEDTKLYQSGFKKLLEFMKPYQPKNLNMTINRVGDQYKSYADFNEDLEAQRKSLEASLDGGLPKLSESMRATLDLNVKTTPDQIKDPKWQEKVQLTHDAYAQVSGRRPYYRVPDKFNIFTTPYPGALSVGTTKDSIAKFWVGVGALQPRGDSFRQIILSPSQLSKVKFDWQDLNIGIEGKNFKKIRILK